MLHRSVAIAALVPLVVLAACGDDNDDNTTNPTSTATVRFINATNTNIDVSNGGTVATGNGNLAFGGSSTCMTVNLSGTGLAFNQAGTTTAIQGFTPSFSANGNFTVVAIPATTGTQFLTLDNSGFTPTSGSAGLRVVNAASGTGSIVALGGGTVIGTGTGVPFGTGGAFMNVAAGSQAITFNTGTGTTTVANAGSLNFTAGQNYTLIVAPAATGSTTLRTFLVTGC
jgi:hypothetical protein